MAKSSTSSSILLSLFGAVVRPTNIRKLKLNLDSGNSTRRLTGWRGTIRSELELHDCGLISGHCWLIRRCTKSRLERGENRNEDNVSRERRLLTLFLFLFVSLSLPDELYLGRDLTRQLVVDETWWWKISQAQGRCTPFAKRSNASP